MSLQITNSNPGKLKNPKRVEQGKKLALISREAKERKKQQQLQKNAGDQPKGPKEGEGKGSESGGIDESVKSWRLLGALSLTVVGGVVVFFYWKKQKDVSVNKSATKQTAPTNIVETLAQASKKPMGVSIESFD